MLSAGAAAAVRLGMVGFSLGMAYGLGPARPGRRGAALVCLGGVAALALEVLRPAAGGTVLFAGLLALLAYLMLFALPVKQRCFLCFFVSTAAALPALAARDAALLLCGRWPRIAADAVFVSLYFLLAGAGLAFFFLRARPVIAGRLEPLAERPGALTAFSAAGYLALLLFSACPADGTSLRECAAALLYAALLVSGYALSFSTGAAAQENALAQMRVRELTAYAEQTERYYTTLASHLQEVRRMQHDSRHHLRVLSGYVQSGAYDLLQEYLSTLIKQSPGEGKLFYCANHTANILLGHYAEEAENEGTAFSCDAQIPVDLPCDPVDLCTVLGNGLENALEACAALPPDAARYISLLARVVGENLTIEIKNSCDGIFVERDGRLSTRKKERGHGLGLDSIRRVAKKYHGYCRAQGQQREFTLRVVLHLQG